MRAARVMGAVLADTVRAGAITEEFMDKSILTFSLGRKILWAAAISLSSMAVLAATSVGNGFATPQAAVQAVVQACKRNDTSTLLKLFGSDGKDIVESGDRKQDKQGRKKFAALAEEKTNLTADPMNPDKTIISIGPEDWPFPVPLIRENGQWHFDSSQGRQEILARRVGVNETTAVDLCHGYVEAQFEYAQTHQQNGVPTYAQKIVSSKGKQDGLYWDPTKKGPECNIPKGFAKAAEASPQPYHGYLFRILTAQGANATGGAVNYIVNGQMIGGFGLVAWPAQYGVSGVQTFIVNHDGTVYQKALGADTAKTVEGITEFNPDNTWRPVSADDDQTP
jgi:hypothetical protein